MLKKHSFWAFVTLFAMTMCIITGTRMTRKHED